MVQRSSLIFAASLAVLSTLEPGVGFAAAALPQHQNNVERPRFMRREVKRAYFANTTTTGGPRAPFGGETSSDLESLINSLTTTPAETTEATIETTSTPIVTSTSTNNGEAQSLQSEISQSEYSELHSQTTLSTSIPSITSDTQESTTSPATTAVSITSPPPASTSEESERSSISATLPVSLPSVVSNTEGASSQTTLAAETTESHSTESTPNQSTSPPVTSSAIIISVQSTSKTTQASDTIAQILPSNPLSIIGNPGSSETNLGSETPATSATIATTSSDGQQSLPGITSEVQPTSITKPTTGVTVRTIPSGSSEDQSTGAGQSSETQLSIGGETLPSITAPSVTQSTNLIATQLSQVNSIIASENSNSLSVSAVQLSSLIPGQQSTTTANAPGATRASESQEQSVNSGKVSAPSLLNSIQQPFTQPSQVPSGGETAASGNEGTSGVAPASYSAAGIVGSLGETLKSNAASVVDSVLPNGQTSVNVVPTTIPTTKASGNTDTAINGILPTVSASLGASPGVGTIGSNANSAQPASSPALPESAVILPTATNSKPIIIPSSGGTIIPATGLEQATSLAGALLPSTQTNAVIPISLGGSEGSTLEGSQVSQVLSSAVPNATPVGSTTLANGVIVPTALSVGAGLSESQPAPEVQSQGQQTGVASFTLSGGSIISNPLASSPLSQQTAAVSLTLPGGSVISNPLYSISEALPTATVQAQPTAPSVALSSVDLVSNPSTPITSVAISPKGSGAALITLSNGVVISNPFELSPVASEVPILTSSPLAPGSGQSSIPTEIPISGPLPSQNSANTPSQASTTDLNGVIVPIPIQTNSRVIGSVPAQATSLINSVVTGNPSVSLPDTEIIPTGETLPPITSATSPVIVGSLTNSNGETVPVTAGQVTGSSTLSAGTVIPVTADQGVGSSTLSAGAVIPVTSGQVVGSSTLSAGAIIPVTSAQVVGSSTLSAGAVIPVTSGQVVGSSTLSEGAVVPVKSSQVVGSSTLSEGAVVPVKSSQVVGSSSLSGGAVIPVTAGQPTGQTALSGSAIVTPSPANPLSSAASGATGSSAVRPVSQTLSNGVIVPISSGSEASSGTSGQTAGSVGVTGQTSVAQASISQGSNSQKTGATESNASGVPATAESATQPAPAPVSGTVTGPPIAPVSSAVEQTAVGTSQEFPSNGKGPFTQQPTGYDTQTIQSVPTSILAQPTSSFASQATYSGSTGLPTGIPLVLYPPDNTSKKPGTELIQVGFLYPLNYDFVYHHPESQSQIFKYLPMGIAWGLQIDIENVTMQSLRAWDTTQDLHYITTLALAWIPTGLVDSLGLLVHTPTSRFYHTPDNSTNTLLSMINIALPIAADNSTDGGDSTSFGAVPTSTTTMKDGGAPVGGGIGSTNPVRASSVGIGVGVACGAAAYGAAMFFVARRYKKRRQSHLRSPSMFSSPVMSHAGADAGAGAALMSGGMGDHRSPSPYRDEDARGPSRGSGRSGSTGRQQISAPVMAENSLGWN